MSTQLLKPDCKKTSFDSPTGTLPSQNNNRATKPKNKWRHRLFDARYSNDVNEIADFFWQMALRNELTKITSFVVEQLIATMVIAATVNFDHASELAKQIMPSRPRRPRNRRSSLQDRCFELAEHIVDLVVNMPTTGSAKAIGIEGLICSYGLIDSRQVRHKKQPIESKVSNRSVFGIAGIRTETKSWTELIDHEILHHEVSHGLYEQSFVPWSTYDGKLPYRIRQARSALPEFLLPLFRVAIAKKFEHHTTLHQTGNFTSTRQCTQHSWAIQPGKVADAGTAAISKFGSGFRQILDRNSLDPILVFADSIVVTGWLPGEE